MKKIIICILIFTFSLVPFSASAMLFHDLDGHWSEEHVYWAVFDVPVFSGYPDGSFRPDDSISRAEFITLLKKVLVAANQSVAKDGSRAMPYTDLSESHWSYDHILYVYQYLNAAQQADLALKQIFPDQMIRPNQSIDRYEVALLTHSVTTPPIRESIDSTPFWDVSVNDPHYQRLVDLSTNEIISGYGDGTFRPRNQLTRGEAAVMARKIYQDLSYLTPNRLQSILPLQTDTYRYSTFDMPQSRSDYTDLDKQMDHVIATLEYKKIVGFIPFDEQDLYDRNPIETLWKLKNSDYESIIANNYYLLTHDQNLQQERKRELATEALHTYLQKDNKQIEGILTFIATVANQVSDELLEQALKAFLQSNPSDEMKVNATILLSDVLKRQGKFQQAVDLYPPLIEHASVMETKLLLVQNEAILRLHGFGTQSAIAAVEKYWAGLKNHSRYWFYEEEIRNEFTSLLKQLLIQ